MASTSETDDIWIEDERLTDLLQFLPFITTTTRADGCVQVEVAAPQDEAMPFVRAMRRIEAQFLIDDGERLFDNPLGPVRSCSERAADAMCELLLQITTAASGTQK